MPVNKGDKSSYNSIFSANFIITITDHFVHVRNPYMEYLHESNISSNSSQQHLFLFLVSCPACPTYPLQNTVINQKSLLLTIKPITANHIHLPL